MRSQINNVPEATHKGIVNKLTKGILINPKQTKPKLPLAGKLLRTIRSFCRKPSLLLSRQESRKSRHTITVVKVKEPILDIAVPTPGKKLTSIKGMPTKAINTSFFNSYKIASFLL